MIKKLPKILLSLCLTAAVLTTAGCAGAASPGNPSDGTGTLSATASSSAGSASDSADKPSGNQTINTAAGMSEYTLLYSRFSGDVFTVNASGERISTYNREEIFSKFLEKGYDFSNASILGAMDGVLFIDNISDEPGTYTEVLYAIDPVSLSVEKLWTKTGYEGSYLNGYEVYNGAFYYTVAGGEKPAIEVKVEKEPGKFSFTKSETGYGKVLNAIFTHATMTGQPEMPLLPGYTVSYTRIMETAGYFLSRNENNTFLMFKENGDVESLRNFPDHWVSLIACDRDCIIYAEMDEDYKYTYYKYDIATGSFEKLPLDLKVNNGALAYEDGTLYYVLEECPQFGHYFRYVYSYDVRLGKSTLLYRQEDIPGLGDYAKPGVDGFKVINGIIYALAPIDGQYTFARVDYSADGSDPTYASIYCPVRKNNALYYGTVSYYSNDYKCPHCGTLLARVYEEYFALNPEYSKFADKINSCLQDKASQVFESYSEGISHTDSSECEYHLEYPDNLKEEQNYNVNDVVFINDKYMAVNMTGYWYGGGAHGQSLSGQYLFDLETGDIVTLRDLYPGTEEEFKRFIAEKTKADYEKYDYKNNMQPYYAADPQSAYDEAYSNASLDTTYIMFAEDKAWIVYEPYEMGPYAGGFIEIPVTYEELLGPGGLKEPLNNCIF
ncbi:MAG: hypothetical protein ILP13_02590 [Lachnospiraceae bacterium]|nr:hypothetical protein [Lachnospiraceae bacterium]